MTIIYDYHIYIYIYDDLTYTICTNLLPQCMRIACVLDNTHICIYTRMNMYIYIYIYIYNYDIEILYDNQLSAHVYICKGCIYHDHIS
jgi:hypothetical protein